jgi:hypothetical protein
MAILTIKPKTLASALEIPTCRCHFTYDVSTDPPKISRPCKHILALNHSLKIGDWIDFLASISRDYAGRPEPLLPSLTLSREVRIEVMSQRDEQGFALYHPLDAWRDPPDTLAIDGHRGRNGAPYGGALRRAAAQ